LDDLFSHQHVTFSLYRRDMDIDQDHSKNKPRRPPSLYQRKPILYLIRAASFLYIYVSSSILINCLQFWGVLVPYMLSRAYYRNFMRFTQRLFGILILITTFIFTPLQIVLTGEHQELNQESFVPIMVTLKI
jgi:hypothetical protein